MEKEGSDCVWEDMRPLGKDVILSHFPNIYQQCLEEGYDPCKEPVPVVPAQHYFMGGIKVDLGSRTSMKRLYACGETSCNGVHGKTVWQVIHCWNHWYLPEEQQMIFCLAQKQNSGVHRWIYDSMRIGSRFCQNIMPQYEMK